MTNRSEEMLLSAKDHAAVANNFPGSKRMSPVARAWAAAKLRRAGEHATEENIQKFLSSAEAAHLQSQETTGSAGSVFQRRQAQSAAEAEALDQRFVELKKDLEEHRSALEESRKRELSMRKMFDSLTERLRTADSFESELAELGQELERSRDLIKELSTRLDESRVEELLRNAEQTHLQEQRELLRAATEREEALLRRVKELENEVARVQSINDARALAASVGETEMATVVEDLRDEVRKFSFQLEQKEERISALNEEIGLLTARLQEVPDPASANVPGDREELERLRMLVADLTGFDRAPGVEDRKILVEVLEERLAGFRRQRSDLQERMSSGGDVSREEKERLRNTASFLDQRIEVLEVLVSESLVFLRRKEAETGEKPSGASDNEQADQ